MARATRACERATRRIGMCGYTAIPALARRIRASQVQAHRHGAQLFERPSTPVPHRLLPPTLRSHVSAASQIRQPTTSGRTALPAEYFCPTDFLCGRPGSLELIARVPERPGRQQRQFQKTAINVPVCNVIMHTVH